MSASPDNFSLRPLLRSMPPKPPLYRIDLENKLQLCSRGGGYASMRVVEHIRLQGILCHLQQYLTLLIPSGELREITLGR